MRASVRLSIAAALAAAATLLPTAAAGARPVYGVQIDASDGPLTIDQQLDAVRRAGGRMVRIEVDWSRLEPEPGARSPQVLANLDRTIDGAVKRGIKVLMFVDRTPCWASSSPTKGDCSAPDANRFDVTRYQPTDPQAYVPVTTFLAARYGTRLTAFEVWNEPDHANEKYWAGPAKVANYVALMRAVYQPLKQANPQLQVLAGSFVGVNGAWLKAMYAAGAQGFYDGLAVHFYDLPLYALKQTRAVQRQHGDTKPMWLSEFGWTSCYRKGGPAIGDDHPCVTEAGQGQALRDLMAGIRRTSWVKAALVYTLQDQTAAYRFGLLDARGRPKPSFSAFRRAAAGKGTFPRPTLRLTRSGGRLVATGTASLADVYRLRASGRRVRYQAFVRTTRFGSYRLPLPASVGTTGVRVTLTSGWSGQSVTRRR